MNRTLPALSLLCLLAVAETSSACSVPVFRYALDHWQRDPYEAVVFHRGEMSSELQAVVDAFSPDGLAGESFANVRVHTVDLDDDPSESQLALWEEQKTDTLPWMVVKYPLSTNNRLDVWAGSPKLQVVEDLIDSPLRRDLARRLLKGESAVWVLLESGNTERDQAALKVLEERIAAAKSRLKLPEIDPQDVAQGLIDEQPVNLKIAFSVLRVRRDDPQEQMLVSQLLGSESDLRDDEYADGPMAFPVFGKGRVLWALVDKGIDANNVDESCEFLVGRCECTVKRQNPGTDLLTAVDWETLIEPYTEIDKELPPLTGLSSFAEPETGDEAEAAADNPATHDAISESGSTGASHSGPSTGGVESPPQPQQTRMLAQKVLLIAGVGVVGVVLVSLLFVARKE